MPDLPLTFGCGLYDRMVPLFSGEVKPEGIDLTFIPGDDPLPLFEAMLDGRFQISEMSSCDLLRRKSAGTSPFVALPVFPSRVFRHGMIAVRTASGIRTPKHLEGRRVGVPHFPMSAAVWIRGILQDEYGVDLRTIEWVQDSPMRPIFGAATANETHATHFRIEDNSSGKSLETLLDEGGIDAYIGADLAEEMLRSPHVRRLFPNFREVEQDYYRRTKLFPIMHAVVVRRELHEAHPWVAKSMFDALTRSKEVARAKMRYTGTLRYMLPWMLAEIEEIDGLFEGDPFAYGLEANRKTLETAIRYLREQALLYGPLEVDDVFAEVPV